MPCRIWQIFFPSPHSKRHSRLSIILSIEFLVLFLFYSGNIRKSKRLPVSNVEGNQAWIPTCIPPTPFYSDVHRHADTSGISSDPPSHREYRRREERYAKLKLRKTASFIEVKPLNVYQITHTLRSCLLP
jgi:hypothetical protein